jgi:hypothetical protein
MFESSKFTKMLILPSSLLCQMILIFFNKFCSLPMYHTYTILYYKQILLVLEKDSISDLESEAKKSSTVL